MAAHGLLRRYPLEPLWRLAEVQWGTTTPSGHWNGSDRSRPFSAVVLADMLDVDKRQVERWKADGGLTAHHVDEVAAALGLTPHAIWPDIERSDTPAFFAYAACRDADTDLFYGYDRADVDEAKAICAGCPVRHDCLDHALETREPHGVWGGKDEFERNRMRRQRGAA